MNTEKQTQQKVQIKNKKKEMERLKRENNEIK